MTTFADLQLVEPLCRALEKQNYKTPTPIQQGAIPHVLAGGDILASAQTGTGKTASFALPILQQLFETPQKPRRKEVRTLVLTPTRELAIQVADAFKTYGEFTSVRCSIVCGGVSYVPQIKALSRGVDVLVATPGRLVDLMNSEHVDLSRCQFLVLDEADRMLDMGFKKDLEAITSQLPEARQTLMFSATMSKEAQSLAQKLLTNPKRVSIEPETVTADKVSQKVLFVGNGKKNDALFELLRDQEIDRAIVFTRTKHIANRLSKKLNAVKLTSEAIHGNKSQNQRQKSLHRFKKGSVRILVATDVAARGIDVDGVSHVINYQLSNETESYVHRIGRTARAGNSGFAITLCDAEDSEMLRQIERMLKRKIEVLSDSPFHDAALAETHLDARKNSARARRGSGRPRGARPGQSRRRRSNGNRRPQQQPRA